MSDPVDEKESLDDLLRKKFALVRSALIKWADQSSPVQVVKLRDELPFRFSILCLVVFFAAGFYQFSELFLNCTRANGCNACTIAAEPEGDCSPIGVDPIEHRYPVLNVATAHPNNASLLRAELDDLWQSVYNSDFTSICTMNNDTVTDYLNTNGWQEWARDEHGQWQQVEGLPLFPPFHFDGYTKRSLKGARMAAALHGWAAVQTAPGNAEDYETRLNHSGWNFYGDYEATECNTESVRAELVRLKQFYDFDHAFDSFELDSKAHRIVADLGGDRPTFQRNTLVIDQWMILLTALEDRLSCRYQYGGDLFFFRDTYYDDPNNYDQLSAFSVWVSRPFLALHLGVYGDGLFNGYPCSNRSSEVSIDFSRAKQMGTPEMLSFRTYEWELDLKARIEAEPNSFNFTGLFEGYAANIRAGVTGGFLAEPPFFCTSGFNEGVPESPIQVHDGCNDDPWDRWQFSRSLPPHSRSALLECCIQKTVPTKLSEMYAFAGFAAASFGLAAYIVLFPCISRLTSPDLVAEKEDTGKARPVAVRTGLATSEATRAPQGGLTPVNV